MRIPFDISKRPQIESGEYKVETRDGKPVRIICWDMDSYNHIVALVANYPNYNGSLSEHIFSYGMDGRYSATAENAEDLFIVTPEPERSEFEQEVYKMTTNKVHFKEEANKLLDLAKSQLLQSGELMTQEHHEELIEKAYKNADEMQYRKGREDVLKDLPRWRIWENGACGNSEGHPIALVHNVCGFHLVSTLGANGEKYIMLSDLEKLPGFKDKNHE